MALTYDSLATTTLSTNTASVTFSNISGNYTDLVLICSLRQASDSAMYVRVNGTTGSSTAYGTVRLFGDGTSAQANRIADWFGYWFSSEKAPQATSFATWIVNLQNYSNTTTFKTMLARSSNAPEQVEVSAGMWRSTAAITEVMVDSNGSNWVAGSTFTLYGVKAA